MQCPKCGVENADELKFCRACGGALQATMPAEAPPLERTEPLPAAAPPPPAPAAPPPAAPPPMAPIPPAPLPAPPPMATTPPGPRRSHTGLIVGIIIGVVVLFIVGIIAVGAWFVSSTSSRVSQTVTEATKTLPDSGGEATTIPDDKTPAAGETQEEGSEAADEGESASPPVPSEDPVAEATVVLEKYLAADLGHNGEEMQKYLGGQAKARFDPSVVGQEDLTVHSKKIESHTVRDENTIDFMVTVEWTPADSDARKIMVQQYVVQRTDEGWRITSTPELSS